MLKEQILFLPEAQSFIDVYRNSFIDSEVTGLHLDMAPALELAL